MRHIAVIALLAVAVMRPSAAEAGPPLICHPFQTGDARLLPWGTGPGWNTPAPNYDLRRLTADILRLLDDEAPVLARMENMRRAVIYASRDRRAAEELLSAVLARAEAPTASRLARFDAGYLIETFKQASHLAGYHVTRRDGYSMVVRAMQAGPPSAAMEFAAALMSEGRTFEVHWQRARRAATGDSLLARNIRALGW